MEIGENLIEVAKREVYEETGLVTRELELFNIIYSSKFYYKYPNRNEVFNVVTAYICKEFTGELINENHEVSEAKFFPLTEISISISPLDKPIIEAFVKVLKIVLSLKINKGVSS